MVQSKPPATFLLRYQQLIPMSILKSLISIAILLHPSVAVPTYVPSLILFISILTFQPLVKGVVLAVYLLLRSF